MMLSRKLKFTGAVAAGAAALSLAAGGGAIAASDAPAIGATATVTGAYLSLPRNLTPVLSANAPSAGTYYVSAVVVLEAATNGLPSCMINETGVTASVGPVPAGEELTVPVVGTVTVAAGAPISLYCRDEVPVSGTTPSTLVDASLHAIQVG